MVFWSKKLPPISKTFFLLGNLCLLFMLIPSECLAIEDSLYSGNEESENQIVKDIPLFDPNLIDRPKSERRCNRSRSCSILCGSFRSCTGSVEDLPQPNRGAAQFHQQDDRQPHSREVSSEPDGIDIHCYLNHQTDFSIFKEKISFIDIKNAGKSIQGKSSLFEIETTYNSTRDQINLVLKYDFDTSDSNVEDTKKIRSFWIARDYYPMWTIREDDRETSKGFPFSVNWKKDRFMRSPQTIAGCTINLTYENLYRQDIRGFSF